MSKCACFPCLYPNCPFAKLCQFPFALCSDNLSQITSSVLPNPLDYRQTTRQCHASGKFCVFCKIGRSGRGDRQVSPMECEKTTQELACDGTRTRGINLPARQQTLRHPVVPASRRP